MAAYLQDNIRWNDLTVNVGLRFDHNNLFLTENQLQPRIGVAYFLKATNTVFRASYNRMFITPEYENILLSSSPEARSVAPPEIQDAQALGGGQLYNLSERHDVYNVGIQQGIGSKLRLDVSYWYRKVKNAADQDQFFNTGIVFPLNFESGNLNGWNVRLDLAPVLGGLRGYVSVGHVHAEYCNPFVGGLFLDAGALDTLGGGCFLIDHDQDIQEQVGFFYDVGRLGFLGRRDAALRLGSRDGRRRDRGRPLQSGHRVRGALHPVRPGPSARQVPDGLELLARRAAPEVRPAVRASGRPPERLRRPGPLQLPVRLRRDARDPAAHAGGTGEICLLRTISVCEYIGVRRAHGFPLLLTLVAAAGPLAAADVTVFAAASLTDALREIAPAWEKATGHRVVFNLAGSNVLARQIRAGAPADLFLSADEAQMDGLEKAGLVVSGTRRSVLSNALAVVVRRDTRLALMSASDLAGPAVRRIALADPRAVPAGLYAKAWLEKAGVWPRIEARVIPTENVRGALAAVASGDAEAGVVYRTDALSSKEVTVAFEAPSADTPAISYPFALLKDAPQEKAARAFLEHLTGAEAREVFRRNGFTVRN